MAWKKSSIGVAYTRGKCSAVVHPVRSGAYQWTVANGAGYQSGTTESLTLGKKRAASAMKQICAGLSGARRAPAKKRSR